MEALEPTSTGGAKLLRERMEGKKLQEKTPRSCGGDATGGIDARKTAAIDRKRFKVIREGREPAVGPPARAAESGERQR